MKHRKDQPETQSNFKQMTIHDIMDEEDLVKLRVWVK